LSAVRVCDVAPRDGLQNDPATVPPQTRAELCTRLLAAGLPRVEAVSFVRDDRVPRMAGAELVLEHLDGRERERCSALVLNEHGLERALACGVGHLHVAVMATETFAMRNVNATVDASLEAVCRMIDAGRASGARVTATVSVAFGCPFEGAVDPGRVLHLAERLALAGADELLLADTIGVAAPGEVARLCARLAELGRPFGVHLHNTRNTGYANAWSALGGGASILEASAGGIGGCPFAPRATGNVATEDLLYLLEREGVDHGVDLDAVLQTVAWLEGVLGRALPGQLLRAGRFDTHPSPVEEIPEGVT
jgi:hydroxymethylglutaryl-CoA lyase/(R)-citramalyl-CoA lyase